MKVYNYENWIRLSVPTNWTLIEEDNKISIYNSLNGYGAITISFIVRSEKEKPSKDELVKFTELQVKNRKIYGSDLTIHIKSDSKHLVSETEYVDGDDYWRLWYLMDQTRVVFVTYNTEIIHKHKEIDDVDLIVESIEFI